MVTYVNCTYINPHELLSHIGLLSHRENGMELVSLVERLYSKEIRVKYSRKIDREFSTTIKEERLYSLDSILRMISDEDNLNFIVSVEQDTLSVNCFDINNNLLISYKETVTKNDPNSTAKSFYDKFAFALQSWIDKNIIFSGDIEDVKWLETHYPPTYNYTTMESGATLDMWIKSNEDRTWKLFDAVNPRPNQGQLLSNRLSIKPAIRNPKVSNF